MNRRPPRPSLTRRLMVLTVGFVLVVQILVLIPTLGRERAEWFRARGTEAHIAAEAVAAAPDGMLTGAQKARLLRLSSTDRIRVVRADGTVTEIHDDPMVAPDAAVDLREEPWMQGVMHAVASVLTPGDKALEVTMNSPVRDGAVLTLTLHERHLARELRGLLASILLFSLGVAGATGAMLYLALAWLLVGPIQRLTRSITAFRADPDGTPPDQARARGSRDEIGTAAAELAAMQAELRAALWRNARLAALGTAVAKISHDVRGILSTALLVAERLAQARDPAVQRSGQTLIRSVQDASDLIRTTLDFAREGPPPLRPSRIALRNALLEVGESVPRLRVDVRVPGSVVIEADRDALFRIAGNLLRNAAEAGATSVVVNAVRRDAVVDIEVADDGPGLPAKVQEGLFRPFTPGGRRGGSGLGLAIAHDLVRAMGGTIRLASTGATGTSFVMTLPETMPAAVQPVMSPAVPARAQPAPVAAQAAE